MNQQENTEQIIAALQCGQSACDCHKNGRGEYTLHCPAHDDRRPSLSLKPRDGELPLVHCHGGCAQDAVISALREKDLWAGKKGEIYPSVKGVTGLHPQPGVTMGALADAKKLSVEFLRKCGVADCKHQGESAARIPYLDPDGNVVSIRFRVGLGKDGARFKWRKGDRVLLYGLDRLKHARKLGWVILVEGESDCWTLWEKDIPALGIPGKSNWRAEWAEHLEGLNVFLWQEPDASDLVLRIAKTFPNFRVIHAPDGIKDPNEAHVLGHDVACLLNDLKAKSVPADSIVRGLQDTKIAELEKLAAPVLNIDDPMQLVEQAIRKSGYGGDIRPAKIVYLAATARLLTMRPGAMLVHLLLIGTPSAGKSWTVKCVLRLLPDDAFHVIDAGSPRALIYDDSDLRHRVVVFSEADSLPSGEDNPAASAVRNLLQDGHLHYSAVVRDPETGDFGVRDVDKAGPSVLITTSVRRLGEQLMTRFFTLEMADTKDQVRAALQSQAALEIHGASEPDSALVAFQDYLQARAGWDVQVPFTQELADAISRSTIAPRILRDFARLLSLIKAVALLRHRRRKFTNDGKVIAQVEDYTTVRELVGEMYSDTVSGASNAVREAVEKVRELRGREGVKQVTMTLVAEELGISKVAASRRIRSALSAGWLANNETRRGFPADLAAGEPLPDRVGLPQPGDLVGGCKPVTSLTAGDSTPHIYSGKTQEKAVVLRGRREVVVL